ncbi:MAG TPA: hypothetical protein QF753_04725 [Victivallales bacterium]|nr:hypothetical protein [Victivallales bacterium]
MKLKIFLVVLTCLFLAQLNASDAKNESSTMIKYCLWPGIWSVPADTNVNGLSFGLSTGLMKNNKLTGCDLALITSETKNMHGFQMGMGTITTNGEGVVVGLVGTDTENFNGGSIAIIVNNTDNSPTFWQIGMYNVARASKGFQIGILNAMDNGFIPICPLFNFSVDSKISSFPVRFCFWPGIGSIPSDKNIYGLSFGVATGKIKNKKVIGCDLGLLLSQTENFTGFQIGLGAIARHSKGVMVGVGTSSDFYDGVMIGFGNKAEDSKSIWQIGAYNTSRRSHGIQIGLLNAMDNGFLPLCPFINFSVSK